MDLFVNEKTHLLLVLLLHRRGPRALHDPDRVLGALKTKPFHSKPMHQVLGSDVRWGVQVEGAGVRVWGPRKNKVIKKLKKQVIFKLQL